MKHLTEAEYLADAELQAKGIGWLTAEVKRLRRERGDPPPARYWGHTMNCRLLNTTEGACDCAEPKP